ncbi:MAG: hypothetical protein ACI9TH_001234 [Kiritimatiellia bacterium]|jgi:hypothetical protein
MKHLIYLTLAFALCTGLYAEEKPSVLRHMVMVKFKKSTSEEAIAALVSQFRALPEKIETIKDFEYGTELNDGARADGVTHCFLVTFADPAGLAAYLPHPAHQDFVAVFKPEIELLKVVDYMSQE